MSSTKLLLITSEFPPQPGGIGTHAYHIATQLSQHPMEVAVLTDLRSHSGKEEVAFDIELPFEVHRIRRKKILAFSYAQRIWKAIRLAKQHDEVLLSGKFSLWVGGVLSLATSKRLIAVIHGSELLLSNALLRNYTHWCLKRFDHVIAVSNFTLSLVNNLQLQNTSVIPNGFEILEEAHFRKKQPEALSLITVGNVTQRKGQHNLVKSLPLLKKTFPNVMYHLVGIPSEKEAIIRLATELDVQNHIKFHGRVTEEVKIALLKNASIFVMLSETTSFGDVEGFGIAILEANAIGVPAIGAINCGIEDAISHNLSGKLVDPHRPDEVVAGVIDIMKSYSVYSDAALSWSHKFRWEDIVASYKKVLNIKKV